MYNCSLYNIIIFLTLFFTCGGAGWDGSITYKNGVMFVENKGTPLQKNRALQLAFKYEINFEEKLFSGEPLDKIRDIGIDNSGKIYVCDGGNCRILIFDSTGNYLKTFGKEGQGPGEFLNPNSISFDQENRIYILDSKLRRVSQFNKDGEFIKSASVREMSLDLAVKDSSSIYLSTLSFLTEGSLIKQSNMRGEIINSFCEKLEDTDNVSMAGEFGKIYYIDNAIYYAFPYPYRIEKFDYFGNRQMVITLFKSEFKPASLPKRMQGKEMILGGSILAKITRMAISESGIIVVNCHFERKAPELDFFSKDGKYLQTISLPENHYLGCIRKGYLYTYVMGFQKFPAITCWEIKDLNKIN